MQWNIEESDDLGVHYQIMIFMRFATKLRIRVLRSLECNRATINIVFKCHVAFHAFVVTFIMKLLVNIFTKTLMDI